MRISHGTIWKICFELNAVTPIITAFLCIKVSTVTNSISNVRRIYTFTIRILRFVAITSIVATFLRVIVTRIVTFTISNPTRIYNITIWKTFIEFNAVTPIKATFFRVIVSTITNIILNVKRMCGSTIWKIIIKLNAVTSIIITILRIVIFFTNTISNVVRIPVHDKAVWVFHQEESPTILAMNKIGPPSKHSKKNNQYYEESYWQHENVRL
mmetsp:Transcript_5342/g.7946  ORF Transcript_5342/g.7946 Transcript_5342/m.7946 type:complete len:212 (-) Transcript_5342:1780-2415(-)